MGCPKSFHAYGRAPLTLIPCIHTGNGKSLVARRLSERRCPAGQRHVLQLHDSDICFSKILTTWLTQVRNVVGG